MKTEVHVDLEDDEDVPVAKRARRSHRKVESDEEEQMTNTLKESDKREQLRKTQSKTESTSRSPKLGTNAGSPHKGAGVSAQEDRASSASDMEEGADMEEKPEVITKARQKVQKQLSSSVSHPYPDWKAGTAVPYAALCVTFSLIEMTTKRLIIMEHCALFLRQVMRLTPEDLLPTVLLMINKLAPDYAGIELGIGESLIMKAIGETTGRSLQVIKADQKEIGDLGLVAVKSRSTQPTMFKPKPLSISGVLKGLLTIATLAGNGAQGRKVDGIKKLLSAADSHRSGKIDIAHDKGGPSEAKYIVRFLEGKLRLGLAEKTVLVSLAQAMVLHEADAKGKVPSTADLEKGESILKTVYRFVLLA